MSLKSFTRAEIIEEGEAQTFEVIIKDKDGVAIPQSAVTALTATLCVRDTLAIINLRTNVNILSQMGATDGKIAWALVAADHVIVDTSIAAGSEEWHRIIIVVTHTGGIDKRVDDFLVRKLGK